MRKVLSFVLVLSLVLGSFSFAFAGAGDLNDIKGEDCEDAVNVLAELDVITGYEDGSFKPENIVTRAEMAVIIIKAMGLEGYATGKSSFTDMAGYDWAQGYVAYAQSRGIIAGYGDGTFKPGQTVSYNEAAKMLVAALGWEPIALVGSWPANYVSKAQDLGILDGVTATVSGATRGDIAIMTYQTLDVQMVKIQSDEDITYLDDGATPVANPITLLAKLNVESFDADGNGTFDSDDDAFVVNGDEDTVISLRPYYGKLVTAYVNDDEEILAIQEIKSTQLTGEYDHDDGVIDVDGVEYTVDAATTDINNNSAAGYIGAGAFENGSDNVAFGAGSVMAINDTFATFFSATAGGGIVQDGDIVTINVADLSGKKVKDIASMVIWNPTKDDLWDSGYADDVKDADDLMGIDFALDDDDNIDMDALELLGADDLASIPEDAVVFIYEGQVDTDNIITRIEVGTTVISGEITKAKYAATSPTGDSYTIDGVKYDVSATNTGFTPPDTGDEMSLFLNYDGDVYDVDKVSGGSDKIALITGIEDGDSTKFDDNPKIELVLADGTSDVFDVDADELIDMYTKDLLETQYDFFQTVGGNDWLWDDTAVAPENNRFDIGDLVKYDMNADGEIDELEVLTEDATLNTNTDAGKITSAGYFNGKKLNSDAVVFVYDGAAALNTIAIAGTAALDVDDFSVTTVEKVLGTDDLDGYYTLDDNGKIDAIVIDGGTTSAEVYGVITDDGDNSSDAEHYVEVLVDSEAATYDTEDTFVAADYDDVYAIEFNASGEADLTAVVTADGGAGENADYATLRSNAAQNVASTFLLDVSSANLVKESADLASVFVGGAPLASDATGLANYNLAAADEFYLDDDADVYVWNVGDACFEAGSISDIEDDDIYQISFYDLWADADDQDMVVDLVLITKCL